MDLERNQNLVKRILRGIGVDDKEKVDYVAQILFDYTGDPRLLNTFLDKFGSDNPWKAAENAVLKRAVFRTNHEIASGTEPYLHGTSESGHKLRNELILMQHKYNESITWTSGSQAIVKIMQEFGNDQQKEALSTEGREKIKKRKARQITKAKNEIDLTLDEILKDPSLIKNIRSTVDRQVIQRMLGINEELQRRILMLDRIEYGNTSFIEDITQSSFIAEEKGGQLLGWFEREKENLPKEIRDLYTTFTNPLTNLCEADRKFMLGSLIVYSAAHRRVKRDSAIGSYQKDLDVIMNLSDSHEIIGKYGRPDLSKIRHILKQKEITLLEATQVIDVYPINEVRAEINAIYEKEFFTELHQTVDELQNLFLEGERWKDDCFGRSIPMSRLKKTIPYSTLSRNDFAAIRNFLRLDTLSKESKNLHQAVAMGEFRDLVNSIVLSGRKLKAMNELIENTDVEKYETNEELIKDIEDSLYRRGTYSINEKLERVHGISIEGIVDRFEKKQKSNHVWRKRQDDIRKYLELKFHKVDEDFEEILEIALKYIPAEDVNDLREKAKKVYDSKVLQKNPYEQFVRKEKDYYHENDVKYFDLLASIEEVVANTDEEKLEKVLELKQTAEESVFYDGSINGTIEIEKTKYNEENEPLQKIERKIGKYTKSVKIWNDVDALEKHVNDFINKYTQVSELEEEDIKKLKFIVSREAEPLLKEQKIETAGWNTSSAVKHLQSNDYVSKELITKVNEIYNKLELSLKMECSVIKNLDELKEGEKTMLNDYFNVKIRGTSKADAGRLRNEIDGFNWNNKKFFWANSGDMNKVELAEATKQIKAYNEKYDRNLKLHVEKA